MNCSVVSSGCGSNGAFQITMVTILITIQPDAIVCRYLFTANLLYMFRVSQHPSSGVLKTVTAASGTGHNTGTATSLQRGLIRPHICISFVSASYESPVFIKYFKKSLMVRFGCMPNLCAGL